LDDDEEDDDNLNNQNRLYSQVLQGKTSMQSIVDDWIETYKKNKEMAMCELIKFVVRCTGCKVNKTKTFIDKELLRTKEFTEFISHLAESYNNENDDNDENNNNNQNQNDDEPQQQQQNEKSNVQTYPLMQTSLQARRFKANIAEFLQLLVNQCQYSIVYDGFMMDVFISFLIGLADSQVRAFRHTATTAVLKIMTSLVDVLLALSVAKDACHRQHETEKRKSQPKRATDRIEMLVAKRKELDDNECDIQNFINFIFKAVFVHRYRDVCADIRCVCIAELGEWMKRCPSKFLDDTFLKYIGWTLYDKQGECRVKCLTALRPLYELEELHVRLELFTSRFKARIVEMCLDKEYDVSVSAIKLLTSIVSKNDAALEDKDCENIYELVFHTNRQIAHAAGEFLKEKLFKIEGNNNNTTNSAVESNNNATHVILLIQFLIESEVSVVFLNRFLNANNGLELPLFV
jgi:cohesin complex subunit SA-1/2